MTCCVARFQVVRHIPCDEAALGLAHILYYIYNVKCSTYDKARSLDRQSRSHPDRDACER